MTRTKNGNDIKDLDKDHLDKDNKNQDYKKWGWLPIFFTSVLSAHFEKLSVLPCAGIIMKCINLNVFGLEGIRLGSFFL